MGKNGSSLFRIYDDEIKKIVGKSGNKEILSSSENIIKNYKYNRTESKNDAVLCSYCKGQLENLTTPQLNRILEVSNSHILQLNMCEADKKDFSEILGQEDNGVIPKEKLSKYMAKLMYYMLTLPDDKKFSPVSVSTIDQSSDDDNGHIVTNTPALRNDAFFCDLVPVVKTLDSDFDIARFPDFNRKLKIVLIGNTGITKDSKSMLPDIKEDENFIKYILPDVASWIEEENIKVRKKAEELKETPQKKADIFDALLSSFGDYCKTAYNNYLRACNEKYLSHSERFDAIIFIDNHAIGNYCYNIVNDNDLQADDYAPFNKFFITMQEFQEGCLIPAPHDYDTLNSDILNKTPFHSVLRKHFDEVVKKEPRTDFWMNAILFEVLVSWNNYLICKADTCSNSAFDLKDLIPEQIKLSDSSKIFKDVVDEMEKEKHWLTDSVSYVRKTDLPESYKLEYIKAKAHKDYDLCREMLKTRV